MDQITTLSQTLQAALEITSGCTEPAAIAYCSSFTGKYLEEKPLQLTLRIDQRTYKNAFAAGIPGAGERKGTEWAIMIGLIMSCPENRLSIFAELDDEALIQIDALKRELPISIELIDTEGLLIHLISQGTRNRVEAKIEGGHTNVVLLQRNGEDIAIKDNQTVANSPADYVFADQVYQPKSWPALIDELYQDADLQEKVRQGIAYNMAAALHGSKYVNADSNTMENLVMGAIYARMNGDPIPVMSCAGSGNKGLTSIIPVVSWARDKMCGEEREMKGVLVSILLTAIITGQFGEVSSVCGAQYAAGAGVIGGILYLRDELELFDGAYNNFVSSIGGGFCDGAKGSCSMRGNAAVSAAMAAINHAKAGFTVSCRDGFLGSNFRKTLENLAKYNPLVARFELETINILKDK